MTRALHVVFLLAATAVPVAHAQEHAFTLYGAYRDGGRFTDATTGQALSIGASGAAAASIDFPLDRSRQLQLFVSRQSSDLAISQTAVPSPLGTQLPLDVTYVHFGGNYFVEGPVGRGTYVVGGLGITLFEPGGEGLGNELRPSLSLGVGYQLPLGTRLALRMELRGYATLVNSSGGFFCSGGCVISIKGDTVTQGEALLGLTFRF